MGSLRNLWRIKRIDSSAVFQAVCETNGTLQAVHKWLEAEDYNATTDEVLLLLSELEAKKTIHKVVSFWIRGIGRNASVDPITAVHDSDPSMCQGTTQHPLTIEEQSIAVTRINNRYPTLKEID